ncbi:MAG TPA: hypothetical protein VJ850_03505 [Candidatus Limnocylindrales bacterium]|nr:hypothetical protein [Candidatus Limnocylindrales bacterium]
MEGRQLRDRDAILIDLVGVAGLVAFFAGLVLLQDSDKLGFDPTAALNGVLGQLGATVPAAVLVLGATALELAAGFVLARLLRNKPFDSLAEALVASMVAAVIKDTFLLGTLAAVGAFRSPVLIAIDVAIVAAGLWLAPVAKLVRPFATIDVRATTPAAIGSWTIAILVALVWAGPVILQLASPVVPFVDVLPNYVGPVEHLRTFGWFSPLSATQSPIIGPSRTVLGYDAFMGSLATIPNLAGGAAIAAAIIPQTILVAAAVHRLARALGGGATARIGPWALLAFALSQSFARLADARGTVVVVPLVCLGLAIAADALREGRERDDEQGAWRFARGPIIGLSLGAATLVHPVIGFFAIVTVAIAALVRPKQLAPDAFVAGLTAGLIAIPQLGVMVGASVPTLLLGVTIPVALVIGLVVARAIDRSQRARDTIVGIATVARLVVPAVLVIGLAGALAIGKLDGGKLPNATGVTISLILESSGLLLVVLVAGIALGSSGARSPLVLAGIGVGIAAVLLAGLLPNDLGFLGDALRYEVPKTVHYWLSTIAAVGAAAALAYAWNSDRLSLVAKGAAIAAFVVVAALPIRFGASGDDSNCKQDCSTINAYHLGEHRYAETFAIDLKFAASGFWAGYPDSRLVVNTPRQQLLDVLRIQITHGELQHDTPVLHIASSFQQWSSTPLGVFDGVNETSISLKPEVSHQTAGGRLFGFDLLPALLRSTADAPTDYGYVVLEPDGLDNVDALRAEILAAGYESIFVNGQGEVFRSDPKAT